jgi:hypothetical protein
MADLKKTAGVLGWLRRRTEALTAWTRREMPDTHSYVSFKQRQLKQKLAQPVTDPLRREAITRARAAIDATEAHMKRRLDDERKQKLQVDFTSAANNPPTVNRNTTTAVRANDAHGKPTDDLVKVRIKGLDRKR